MNGKRICSRRQFLKSVSGSAVGIIGFPYIVPSSVFGADGSVAPSERIVIGCIGVGSQGTSNMSAFLNKPDVKIFSRVRY